MHTVLTHLTYKKDKLNNFVIFQDQIRAAVIFHSYMVVSPTTNVPLPVHLNFGVQHKWMKMIIILKDTGNIVMKIARQVSLWLLFGLDEFLLSFAHHCRNGKIIFNSQKAFGEF